MANESLRKLTKEKKVRLWEIGYAMGVSEATIVRKLRLELSESEKEKFITIINSIADNRGDEK